MKKIIILTTVLIVSFGMAFSQGDTLMKKSPKDKNEIRTIFGDNKISHGGYLGLTFNYSQIDKRDALLAGSRIGWVINHSLMLGVGGYGFANDVYIDNVIDGKGFNLAGGYGGFYIEPIILGKQPFHLSLPVLIGAGGIAYMDGYSSIYNDDWDYVTKDVDAYLVLEPGIELEMNVLKHFRVATGVTYRMAYDVNLINTKKDVLNGLTYGISFKIGKF